MKLDPFDRRYYLARIPGEEKASPPDSIALKLEDITREGQGLKIPFVVSLRKDGRAAPAGAAGWAMHIEVQGNARLGPSPGETEHTWFLDVGRSSIVDTLFLPPSAVAPKIQVTVEGGERTLVEKVPIWVAGRLFTVVLFAGAITSLLRFLHQQIGRTTQESWKRLGVHLVLSVIVGAGTAVLLYVLLVGLPASALEKLQPLASVTQSLFGQLAIGVVGGAGGFEVVKRLVDKLGGG